ncbi:MAG TPA: sulfotransferase domain-containing protein [Kofleriaceae bacterium]|nr:sulfotransferase domain-containing protein [Kofleriaceae bacterium]
MRQFLEQVSARSPVGMAVARRVSRTVRRWWRHQRTSGYVLSYPGSGRTWLTVLIGKALIDQHRLEGMNPAAITDLADLRRGVPRIEVRHDDSPQLRRPDEVERDKSRYARKSVVLLVRDPRDAIISYFFEASKRRGRFEGSAGQFLRHPVGGLDTLITYYNVWAEHREVPRRFCLVRYEDLHREPVDQLGRVMSAFGQSPSHAILEGAVEFSRFENMRKMEAKGFARPELDRRDPADVESFKTRKGKVGGYREYLSPEDVDYLNARIAERLSPYYADYLTPK